MFLDALKMDLLVLEDVVRSHPLSSGTAVPVDVVTVPEVNFRRMLTGFIGSDASVWSFRCNGSANFPQPCSVFHQ